MAYDILFLGGGLHCGLAALAVGKARPDLKIGLVEAGDHIGGNHLWSYHASDVSPQTPSWLDELVAFEWPRHEVRFKGTRRIVESAYKTITSNKLHDSVVSTFAGRPNADLLLGRRVISSTNRAAILDDGTRLEAALVLDGRGVKSTSDDDGCGYQKFCGMELVLGADHGFEHPILMDATVAQHDGFRFVYVLPFARRRLFVEDTYFSGSSTLDRELVRNRVTAYARELGLDVVSIGRQEEGRLPMPWKEQPLDHESVFSLGTRGGWYHPATAYSIPFALRIAAEVTRCTSPDDLSRRLVLLRDRHQRQSRFARLLNRLLFGSYSPEDRVNVFEKFYKLPEATIQRFYSLELTTLDQLRILSGRPPRGFSLRRSLRSMEAFAR